MRGDIYHINRILIVGLQDEVILDVQIRADLAVRGPFIGQEIPGFDEQRRNPRKSLRECVDIADTPCQPPYAGRLSATRFKAAVYIAREVYDKGCAIVGPEPGIRRTILAHDLETASVFLLGCIRADPRPRQAPTGYAHNNGDESELDWFDLLPTVHCVQL